MAVTSVPSTVGKMTSNNSGQRSEYRIVNGALPAEERARLLEDLRDDGWTPILGHEGAVPWLDGFPAGFVVLERRVPEPEEPRWCAW